MCIPLCVAVYKFTQFSLMQITIFTRNMPNNHQYRYIGLVPYHFRKYSKNVFILERGNDSWASSVECLLRFLLFRSYMRFSSVKLSSFVFSLHPTNRAEQRIEKFILAKRDKARFVV